MAKAAPVIAGVFALFGLLGGQIEFNIVLEPIERDNGGGAIEQHRCPAGALGHECGGLENGRGDGRFQDGGWHGSSLDRIGEDGLI